MIYLIRHGQKQKTSDNPFLTNLGIQQAQLTSQFFSNKKIDQVIASPLNRTQQTAQIINESINVPIKTDTLLRERIEWGEIPNQTLDQFVSIWEKMSQNRDYQLHNINSAKQSGLKLEKAIKKYSQPNQNIIFITHGGIISDFLINNFDKQDLEKLDPNFDFIFNSNIKECSITAINYSNNKFILKSLASISHL